MEACQKVYDTLGKMGIDFELVEHPPAPTAEEADRYIEGKEGVRTKTLFLCNKKSTAFYLVIVDDQKRMDMKELAELLDEKRLSFASAEKLMAKMALPPGTVSLFGLINNHERDIKIYLDKDMLEESIITFHPNDNSKTVFIAMKDMYKFITNIGYEYKVIDL
jgi:Ala-tRNA(Pro) deacylase